MCIDFLKKEREQKKKKTKPKETKQKKQNTAKIQKTLIFESLNSW